ncbi:MAG: hypothetical protein HY558_08495 [Euryarchaeota archaeon]|nr:hypothetical protein [Euryarchaeota archaeon]
MAEEEYGRIKKNDSTEIVIRRSEYRGLFGIDIREYVNTATYTGWSKSGIRIPENLWTEFRDAVNKVKTK